LLQEQRKDNNCVSLVIKLLNNIKCAYKNYTFVLRNNILFARLKGSKILLPVIPTSLIKDMLVNFHDLQGHFGVLKTLERIKSNYFVFDLHKLVVKYVHDCIECQLSKKSTQLPHGLLCPIKVTELWERVGVDIIGPLPLTNMGNKYICTAVDMCSRFLVTKAIRKTNSKTIAEFFINNIIFTYGLPKEIYCDNASYFKSDFTTYIVNALGCKSLFISPYSHTSAGCVESMNKIIENLLVHYINASQTNWDRNLNMITYFYNCSYSKALKHTPFFLNFGRIPNTVFDLSYRYELHEQNLQDKLTQLNKIRKEAKLNLSKSQSSSKKIFDKNRKEAEIKVNDIVLLQVPYSKKGQTIKFSRKFVGPFIVTKAIGNLRRHIKPINENLVYKGSGIVSVRRLKLFNGPTDREVVEYFPFDDGESEFATDYSSLDESDTDDLESEIKPISISRSGRVIKPVKPVRLYY
jgi:hypothetical protein